jgi:hypothetical protein
MLAILASQAVTKTPNTRCADAGFSAEKMKGRASTG